MPDWIYDIIYPLSRWIHMVSMTLIVGGTLFFELVLPVSIDDLRKEQQLFVFARARLVFRWVVWIGAAGLLLSGCVSLYRMWFLYATDEFRIVLRWAVAHISLGAIGLCIALLLTIGRHPPEDPVRWMRLNLVILLIAIFLGSATRHFQLAMGEREQASRADGKVPPDSPPASGPSTGPASMSATAPAAPSR